MTETTHTEVPWALEYLGGELHIVAGSNPKEPIINIDDGCVTPANRDRIVACVNGCKGINPEAVPGLVEALKKCMTCSSSMNQSVVELVKAALAEAKPY